MCIDVGIRPIKGKSGVAFIYARFGVALPDPRRCPLRGTRSHLYAPILTVQNAAIYPASPDKFSISSRFAGSSHYFIADIFFETKNTRLPHD